jgi:hypothetical protein
MLGFKTFSGSPIASTGNGAIVDQKAEFYAEALLQANANADWASNSNIIGEAMLNTDSTIAGSGWVRQNPSTPEWDMDKSQDWNKIK